MSSLHLDRFSWFISTGLLTASVGPRGPGRRRPRTTLSPEASRCGPVLPTHSRTPPCSKRGRSFAVYKTLLGAPAIRAARGLPSVGGRRPGEVVMAQVTRGLQDSDPAVPAPSSGRLQLILPREWRWPPLPDPRWDFCPLPYSASLPAQPCTVGFPDAQLKGHLPAPSLPSRVPASSPVLPLQPQGLSRSL